jgi:hypothetical protein
MTFFSLALMNIFGFHAINSAFTKCFPKKGKEQNHSSAPVFVCAVVLTLRLFVHWSLFLCVRILFVDAVHTRGPQQFNTTHIAYTV